MIVTASPAPRRAKTSPDSTAGSFAPHEQSSPGAAAQLQRDADVSKADLDALPAYLRHDYTVAVSLQLDGPPRHLSLHTSNCRAREVVSQVRDGHLDTSPPYQRGSVWTLAQRQGLLRSWCTGVPIPAIYVNDRCTSDWHQANGYSPLDTGQGLYGLVDGRQRCETVIAWYDSQFGVPASWFDPGHVESTFETADGPYVTMSHLTDIGQRLFDNRAMLPVTTAQVATVEDEAALYLLVNGAGTAQTDEDLANAARVASGAH